MNRISVFFSLSLLMPTILAGCASFPSFTRQAATPVATTPDSTGDGRAETSANSIERSYTLKRSIEQIAEALDSQPQEAAPPKQAEPADQGAYIVRRGDTLSIIAQAFLVSTQQLQYRNNLKNPNLLQVGTYLTIPNRDFEVPHTYLSDNDGPDFIWPVRKPDISSDFGSRAGQHAGIDFRAPRDTEILSAADGVVLFSGTKQGYGRTVVIQHADKVRTLYAHNHVNLVRKGQRVQKGDVIATVGRSGNATGYHVHFEYIKDDQKLNPHLYVYQDDTPGEEVALNQ